MEFWDCRLAWDCKQIFPLVFYEYVMNNRCVSSSGRGRVGVIDPGVDYYPFTVFRIQGFE